MGYSLRNTNASRPTSRSNIVPFKSQSNFKVSSNNQGSLNDLDSWAARVATGSNRIPLQDKEKCWPTKKFERNKGVLPLNEQRSLQNL
ncbi:hypothetical protein SUGI_1150710 [Cryptomeria japonica]|nr:hypothetical protein SUGI_1150710 [Cryptomeria japonica]